MQYLSNDGLTVSGNRFRRIRDVDMKHDFAFVVSGIPLFRMGVLFVFWLTFCKQEFSNPRDADDARYSLDGRDFDGSRIIVEFARGVSFY